ncbi:FkbM family methyltransferase [Phaeobacter sp.]|uniref:FkbM family methyltransferase n=1 Tax=Phaeobacter sp. TaxID=1902409 RepID=UPI0025F73318|nr:FkbM family methyltransferase [Phaeobacter sp.]
MQVVETKQNKRQETRRRAAVRARLSVLDDAFAPSRALRIVDIGANPINTPPYADLFDLGGCDLWGFEPGDEAFAALQAEQQDRAHYVKAAVGKPGPADFYPHPQSGLASCVPIDAASVARIGKARWHKPDLQPIQMTLVGLDQLDEAELPKPDVVKIDIQGGELDVFVHGRDRLSDAICVICEVRFHRIYQNEPKWREVDEELAHQGFALHKFDFTKTVGLDHSQRGRLDARATRSQLLDGDAIYIRALDTMDEWTDTQVKSLAYTAACVIDSHDLALVALDELVRRGSIADTTPETYVASLPRWMRQSRPAEQN